MTNRERARELARTVLTGCGYLADLPGVDDVVSPAVVEHVAQALDDAERRGGDQRAYSRIELGSWIATIDDATKTFERLSAIPGYEKTENVLLGCLAAIRAGHTEAAVEQFRRLQRETEGKGAGDG